MVAETQSYKPTEVEMSKQRQDPSLLPCSRLRFKIRSNGQASQILVGEMGRLLNCRENIESGPESGVGQRGQVDQRLDRPIPELPPNPLIFLPYVVVCRVWRPVDAYLPEVFQARFDSAIAPIQAGVEFRLHAGDRGTVGEILGMA